MDIRLIALDLDGTALLPDHASFSPRTEAALLAAHRRGVAVVPTTGRQFAVLPPPLQVRQPWADLAVLCNGAEVRRLATGEVLEERPAGGTLYLTQADWDREREMEGLMFHMGVLGHRGRAVE